MAPWNRAYRRTLFTEGGIRFATKVWYEDIRIVTKVLALAEQVVRLPGAYYHYLQREGSAMNNKTAPAMWRSSMPLTTFSAGSGSTACARPTATS